MFQIFAYISWKCDFFRDHDKISLKFRDFRDSWKRFRENFEIITKSNRKLCSAHSEPWKWYWKQQKYVPPIGGLDFRENFRDFVKNSWFRENSEDMFWSIQKEARLLTISPHCIETYRRHPKGENVHWECSRIPDSVREFVIWFVISWKYSWFVCGAQKGVWSSTILPQSIMNVSNVLRGVRLYIDTPAITLMFQIQFMNSGFHEIFVISWKFWGCALERPKRSQTAHHISTLHKNVPKTP